AEAVDDGSLFDNENVAMIGDDLRQHALVVWLEISAAHDRHAHATLVENVSRRQRRKDHRADGKNGDGVLRISPRTRTATQDLPRRVRNRFDLGHRRNDVRRRVAWIPQTKRSLLVRESAA